jgi:hypothetical protein
MFAYVVSYICVCTYCINGVLLHIYIYIYIYLLYLLSVLQENSNAPMPRLALFNAVGDFQKVKALLLANANVNETNQVKTIINVTIAFSFFLDCPCCQHFYVILQIMLSFAFCVCYCHG